MAEFQPLEIPLRGWQLVEANAGTGKTYNIATLYLRLLCETDLQVEQILVMTYTRSATAELGQRIAAWIQQALSALEGQTDGVEETVVRLATRNRSKPGLAEKLRRSLFAIDLAAIHTIHGFCMQALERNDFAAGFRPDFELMGDDRLLLEAAFGQTWRAMSAELDADFAEQLLAEGNFTDACFNFVRLLHQHPGSQILSADAGPNDWPWVVAATATAADRLQQQVLRHIQDFVDRIGDGAMFQGNRVWAKNSGRLLALLAKIDGHGWQLASRERDFRYLSGEQIESALRKGAAFDHPLIDAMDEFQAAVVSFRHAFEAKRQMLMQQIQEQVEERLKQLKHRFGQYAYDDLVTCLRDALASDDLLASLRADYRVALIDEFQDTDAAQFDIFKRLFAHRDDPVFIVGDPKQAMYNFRGADVFAYLQAREHTRRQHTLSANWRSEPRLVKQVNALFGAKRRPFVLDSIGFQPSTPALPATDDSGLHAWLLPLGSNSRRLNKDQLSKLAVNRTVDEIGSLLGQARAVPADVAVLVRTHKQGVAVAEGLRARGIKSVQVGRSDIFSQPEAVELELILRAISQPANSAGMRAALTTRLLGWTVVQVEQMVVDDDLSESQSVTFARLQEVWRQHGLARLVLDLLQTYELPKRLLRQPDGERAMANLFQLLDLIYQQQDICDQPARLLRWLRRRRQSKQFSEDELQHLSSDADLVRLVTIHAAKGMQYPIVFCPFLWDAGRTEKLVAYHDPATGRHRVDLGSSELEQHRGQAEAERLSEELRIAYVALTRAERRAYLCWGISKGGEDAALRYLLHAQGDEWDSGRSAFKDPKTDLATWRQARANFEALGFALELLGADLPDQSLTPSRPTLPKSPVILTPPSLPQPSQKIVSFSSLAKAERGTDVAHQRPDSETLPSNNTVGLMLHDVLERLPNFSPSPEQLEQRVVDQLRHYGISQRWAGQAQRQITNCLNCPLLESGHRLADLPPEVCRAELGFDLRLDNAYLTQLNGFLLQPQLNQERSAFDGFLTGAIDLVFRWQGRYFVVDYKSNYLGPAYADYAVDRLRASIGKAGYDLQYLLYTTALHRHLQLRLPGYDYEAHFGGVFYLYLRGIDPRSPARTGIYYERPAVEKVLQIDQLLGAG